MSGYIDLSYTISQDIAVHPYDEKLKLRRHKFLSQDEFNDSKLETGMHVGTHIDAPSHLLESPVLICDYPIEKFIGNGCLLDVRNQEMITMKEVYKDCVKENDIVILYTGWDKRITEDIYFTNHPTISEDFAQFLIDRKIKIIGMDLPSPDQFPFPIHKMFLSEDILIIENLTNLESLLDLEEFEIIAIPLKIKAEASPVRVVANIKR
jgi:kynurenine formamidase